MTCLQNAFSAKLPQGNYGRIEGLSALSQWYRSGLMEGRDVWAVCFPPEWSIMDQFILMHHRVVCDAFGKIVAGKQPAQSTPPKAAKDASESAGSPTKKIAGLFGMASGKSKKVDDATVNKVFSPFAQFTAQELLKMIAWIEVYGKFLEQFACSLDTLHPKLLDGAYHYTNNQGDKVHEASLIGEYVRQAGVLITSWIRNIQSNEVQALHERLELPEQDAEGHYYTPATIDLFQIIKQHILAALEVSSNPEALLERKSSVGRTSTALRSTPSSSRLSVEVARECYRAVKSFQSSIQKALLDEKEAFLQHSYSKSTTEKPTLASNTAVAPIAPYFEDYVIQEANGSLRWIEYADELVEKFSCGQNLSSISLSAGDYDESVVWAKQTEEAIKEMSKGFLELAKTAVAILLDVIMTAVHPAVSNLFRLQSSTRSGEWYGEPGLTVNTITATFDDFLMDYVERADAFIFERIVRGLLDRIVLAYLEAMRHPKVKFINANGAFGISMRTDLEALSSFFSKKIGLFSADVELKGLNPLKRISSFLQIDKQMLFLDYVALAQIYPDIPQWFVEECLVGKRDDLEKSDSKAFMEALRKRNKDSSKTTDAPLASIFAKLRPLE